MFGSGINVSLGKDGWMVGRVGTGVYGIVGFGNVYKLN